MATQHITNERNTCKRWDEETERRQRQQQQHQHQKLWKTMMAVERTKKTQNNREQQEKWR